MKTVDENGTSEKRDLRFFLMPQNTYIIISKEWVRFTTLTSLAYLNHIFWILWGVDAYCSYERHMVCGDFAENKRSEQLYDIWIALTVGFHMIEWLRHTIFATSALVGVDLVGVFYGLFVGVPFGIILMFGGAIAGFSSPAECKTVQVSRSMYLECQILAIVLTMLCCCLHAVVYVVKGVDWC